MDNSCCRGISRFYKELNKLKKHYPEVIKDIQHEFNYVPFIDLFNRNYRLQDAGNFRLIKHRVANLHNQSGKSGGFRVYYIANKTEEKVTFLTIYPKSNRKGVDNLDKNQLKTIIKEFKEEMSLKKLVTLNFEDI